MSQWDDQLRDASFKGIKCRAKDVSDDSQKAVARFSYAETDYPDIEEMSVSTQYKIRAVFDEDIYNTLEAFIQALEEHGPGTLVHPTRGAMQASALNWSILHDDREFFADVDITFEQVNQIPVVRDLPTLHSQAQALQVMNADAVVHEQAMLGVAYRDRSIPTYAPTAGLGLAGYLSTVAGLSGAVRKQFSAVSGLVGVAISYVTPYVAPLQLIAADLTAVATLPGAVCSQISTALNSVAGIKTSMLNLPGRLSAGLDNSCASMESSFGEFGGIGEHRAVYRSQKARAKVSAAALELRADEAAEKGDTLTLRDYGQPDVEVSRSQTMTIDEIDALVAGARGSVNDALDELRTGYGDGGYTLETNLKAQAALLQEMADEIRLRRPQIIEHTVDADTSVRLLCFGLYRDIRRAPEVLRLNKVKDPNFLQAGTVLRVYAS